MVDGNEKHDGRKCIIGYVGEENWSWWRGGSVKT